MNEERNEDENDEEKEEEERKERKKNKTQVKEFKENRTQKINEKIVNQRRMFIISKSFILRRSSIEKTSRTNDKKIL